MDPNGNWFPSWSVVFLFSQLSSVLPPARVIVALSPRWPLPSQGQDPASWAGWQEFQYPAVTSHAHRHRFPTPLDPFPVSHPSRSKVQCSNQTEFCRIALITF